MEAMDQDRILSQLRTAAAKELELQAAIVDLLAEANGAKIPWPSIGEALGVTAEKARWRFRQHKTDAPSLQARKAGTAPGTTPAPRPASGSGPGMSVAEAAKALSTSRTAIYRMVADGRLTSSKDAAGYLRVTDVVDAAEPK